MINIVICLQQFFFYVSNCRPIVWNPLELLLFRILEIKQSGTQFDIFLNPRKRLSEGRSQLRDWISQYWLRIIEVNLFPISSSLIFIKYSVNFIKIFMLIVSFTVTTWQVLWLKLNWFIYQPPSWDSIS